MMDKKSPLMDDFRYNVAIDVVLFSLLVIISTFELKLGIVGRIASLLIIPFVLSYLFTLMSVVIEKLKFEENKDIEPIIKQNTKPIKKRQILRRAANA